MTLTTELPRRLATWLSEAEKSRLWRWAVFALGVAAVLVSVAWVVSEILEWRTWPESTDMELYLHAAGRVASGLDPYSDSVGALHRYPYPPLFADLLAVLMALFGRMGAAWLWVFASIGFAIGGVALLCRRFGFATPLHWIALAAGIVLIGHVGRADLLHGQVNFFLFLLLVSGFVCWYEGRVRAAAVLWAVVLCCKPFLGIVVFFLLRRSDWSAALWTVAVSAVLFAASFLPTFPNLLEAFGHWREVTQFYSSPAYASNPLDQSWYGFALRAFTQNAFSQPWTIAPLMVPVTLAIAAVVGVTAFWVNAAPVTTTDPAEVGARNLLSFGAALAALLGLSPVTEGDHLYYVMPGIIGAIVIAWLRLRSGVRWRLWLAVAASWAPVTAYIAWPRQSLVFFSEPSTWAQLHGLGIFISAACAISLMIPAVVTAIALRTERRAPVTRSA